MNRQNRREFVEEYACINGISQYLLHYPAGSVEHYPASGGKDCLADGDNHPAGSSGHPAGSKGGGAGSGGEVMLIIHGGPGMSEAHFAYCLEESSNGLTTVYYDQRGAGKTLTKNRSNGDDINFEQLLSDLHQTVLYLQQKYHKERIIISGHSWGSILGLNYAAVHPENLLGYIACGQVVNMRRGEQLIYGKLLEIAKDKPSCLRLLRSLGDYPANVTTPAQINQALTVLAKAKKQLGAGIDTKKLQQIVMKSPIFKLSDMLAMFKAQKLSARLHETIFAFSAESLTKFQIPIYLIHATQDWQLPIELSEAYYESITAPDKGFYKVEKAGHIMMADNLDGTITAINAATERCLAAW